MYTTASQEVRVASAAFCDPVFCDSVLDGFVGSARAVVGGAAGAWCVESLISVGALAESDVEALLVGSGTNHPRQASASSARTPSAATETTPGQPARLATIDPSGRLVVGRGQCATT